VDVWNVWQWAVASNERAVTNARAAAIDCSRRRLESAEVQDYLDRLTPPASFDEGLLRVSRR
jgi:hypothetical protein